MFVIHSIWLVLTVFLATLSMFLSCLGAARVLHNDLLHKVIRAPMAFFDRTPLGRIINRFSHDVSEVDNDFPATLRAWASCIFTVLFCSFKEKNYFNLLLLLRTLKAKLLFILSISVIHKFEVLQIGRSMVFSYDQLFWSLGTFGSFLTLQFFFLTIKIPKKTSFQLKKNLTWNTWLCNVDDSSTSNSIHLVFKEFFSLKYSHF